METCIGSLYSDGSPAAKDAPLMILIVFLNFIKDVDLQRNERHVRLGQSHPGKQFLQAVYLQG